MKSQCILLDKLILEKWENLLNKDGCNSKKIVRDDIKKIISEYKNISVI